MHASTESLLSYRDGEPLSAPVREHIDGCTQCQATLLSMKALRTSLQQLQRVEVPPPLDPGLLKIDRDSHWAPWPKWAGGVAASLLVAASAVFLLQGPTGQRDDSGLDSRSDDDFASQSQIVQQVSLSDASDPPSLEQSIEQSIEQQAKALDQLVFRSNQLENTLRRLPARPALASVRVASTEANLVSQLELIDFGLSEAGQDMSAKQQQRLWRGRIALMDSLVNLRYAQFRRASL